ncbi:hypothetical protein PssvBMR4_gp63 [Pseudomonas phage MR4]|uniref:Uncharacterized protein n=1 Tax=Pseudomonas phage MR4 TaxID=2711171 RepID=A0A6M3TCL4_9CAUD|nr:hypothetical protein PssvBMR4_gp63 [Pseudomonas phage MR4]
MGYTVNYDKMTNQVALTSEASQTEPNGYNGGE